VAASVVVAAAVSALAELGPGRCFERDARAQGGIFLLERVHGATRPCELVVKRSSAGVSPRVLVVGVLLRAGEQQRLEELVRAQLRLGRQERNANDPDGQGTTKQDVSKKG
jgi:hypothetical protein